MEVVCQGADETGSGKLAVFQNQRHILDNEHDAVTCDTEDDFRQHGVDVGIPVSEPAADGLADIQHQDEHGSRIAEKTDDRRQIDDVFQFVDVQNIAEQPGEKRSCAQRNDCEVKGDPQAETEVIVHAGFTQTETKHAHGGIKPP